MSRIGKKPVAIPSGVEVTVAESIITVKKGNKSIDVNTHDRVGVEVAEGMLYLHLEVKKRKLKRSGELIELLQIMQSSG